MGDWNPLHFSLLFASKTRFKRPIAHGFLVGALISALLARELPGIGTLYESQSLFFDGPVYIGDVTVTEIKVVAVEPEKGRITLSCEIRNEDGDLVLHGEAVVRVPKPKA